MVANIRNALQYHCLLLSRVTLGDFGSKDRVTGSIVKVGPTNGVII